ncbi:hypothetical protein [Aquihabitans sp. McL0605]|uniref:HNH endonuclease signature motif containing protein n=1 Tax=Aquihabitans sp. McL0605 TaxID=3415671 RepID=UPI003CF51CFF
MVFAVSDPRAQAVFAGLDAAFDALDALELDPGSIMEAAALARRVERYGRRMRSKQIDVIETIEERGLHLVDGHASGRVMVGLVSHLSEPEAKRRDRARRMFAAMPAVKLALATGRIGACQVDRISLVYVNPRVQAELVKIDAQVAQLAAVLEYAELDRRLTNWVRMVDEDGTADRARRAHENRRARLLQDFDGGWELLCLVGGLTGAQMHAIFRAFVEAEFQADWAEARDVHGEATTVEHLARTFDQRDADAVARIFELAANAFAATPGGAPIDLTIVMDNETFEREARRAAGANVEPRPVPDLGPLPDDADMAPRAGDAETAAPDAAPTEPSCGGHDAGGSDEATGHDPADHPGREFRCETGAGHPIDPTEAFANAFAGRIRRAVVGWDGVVLDMSGLHKLFTGPLREAVMLSSVACYWPGCGVKIAHCQADHLQPRRSGGRTNPGNGGPACGRHNRLKEHGFTVRRDQRGRLHVYRPDGTEIDH